MVALGFEVAGRDKFQGGGVDAISQPPRLYWAVIEDMAQVGASIRTADFLTNHTKGMVGVLMNVTGINGFGE